jgi:dethiobiotin synthetase
MSTYLLRHPNCQSIVRSCTSETRLSATTAAATSASLNSILTNATATATATANATHVSKRKNDRMNMRFHSTMTNGVEIPPQTTSGDDTANTSRPIYVAATKQHVGKTTTCLALMSGLKKRFPNSIGFLKPVGQQHVPVYSDVLDEEIRVDKDVTLMKEHFKLHHCDYRHMSPVLIPDGYTKDYIDGKISNKDQLDLIINAVKSISSRNEVILCEGTGHCAVGSIVGASNAKVANLIGGSMVLIANGGLGSCFDELELNRVLCEHHNVDVAGVIINKVLPQKYDQTKDYMTRALEQQWGIPLLGCVPDRPYLGCPALADLERLFKTTMITGENKRFQHYTVHDMNLVTTSLTRFLSNLREKPTRTLYLCHVTRDDIILGFLGEYQRRKDCDEPFEAALVICGREEKYDLSEELRDMITNYKDVDVPILFSPFTTHNTMEKIHSYTPKLNIHDGARVDAAVSHYEEYIDYDLLLSRTGNALVSQRTATATTP